MMGCAASAPPLHAAPESEGVDSTAGNEGDDSAEPLPVAGSPAPSVVAEAARIVASARETTYAHHTHIDEATGQFDLDCSAFAGYVLLRAAPAARDELIAATVKRPLARDFVGLISRLPTDTASHWRRLARATDLAPGDLIAWLRPADSKSRDTGHVMVVASPPRVHGNEADVAIYDASALHHGRDDQRSAGARTGVGRGSIVLELDAAGQPIAFRWGPGAKFHRHETTIVFGRAR